METLEFNEQWLNDIMGSASAQDAIDAYFVYRTKQDAENALFALANCDNVPVDFVRHLRGVVGE